MKILFICGSLEPGKDGVGDYTRRLAGELIRQGHNTSIIALNDKHISSTEKKEQQADLDDLIPVIRLSANHPSKQRLQTAKAFVSAYNPDWISLQFVPFAFHHKGLPFKLASDLKKIGRERTWQIMFHELWVGMDEDATMKDKLWGRVQKGIISRLIHKLSVKKIHTQTGLYFLLLKQMGLPVKKLPLFGNIYSRQIIAVKDIDMRKDDINVFLFANIHYGAPVQLFCSWLKQAAAGSAKNVFFHFIGDNGVHIKEWIAALEEFGITHKIWGRQPAEIVLQVLNQSSFGVTTTPFFLTEKSGAVAAMIEYSLPVLCVARNWNPRGVTDMNSIASGNIIKWRNELSLAAIYDSKRSAINLKMITKDFLEDLAQ